MGFLGVFFVFLGGFFGCFFLGGFFIANPACHPRGLVLGLPPELDDDDLADSVLPRAINVRYWVIS